MLYINALRGNDSTGVFYITNLGDVQTHKEVGNSGSFLKTKEWEGTEKELFRNGQAVVGHCRASTRGAKTDQNAHPFIVDNKIVLVHNGTYNGSHTHLAQTDVDSHAIAHVLAETDNIPEALQKINAAYALVWYNTETKRLYMVRNAHRPLFIAQMDDGSMMFASEIAFIYTAAWRNNLKIHKDYPLMLPEHQLFSCNLEDISEAYQYEDIDGTYRTPVKKEEPVKVFPKSPLALVPTNQGRYTPPEVTRNTERFSNGVPSLTEVAEDLKLGIYTPMDHGWWRMAAPGTTVLVEATDYHAVDATAGIYYVYGKIISTNLKLNGMIAGWEITADHEMEVVDYVSDHFYKCTVEYNLSRGVTQVGSQMIVIWKMSNAELANIVPVETMEMNA